MACTGMTLSLVFARTARFSACVSFSMFKPNVNRRHSYLSRFGFAAKRRTLRFHCMALSGLRLNCVVIVRLEIALNCTVRFKVGLCSFARFKTALSYFRF